MSSGRQKIYQAGKTGRVVVSKLQRAELHAASVCPATHLVDDRADDGIARYAVEDRVPEVRVGRSLCDPPEGQANTHGLVCGAMLLLLAKGGSQAASRRGSESHVLIHGHG